MEHNPTQRSNPLDAAGLPHAQEKNAGMRLLGLINQCAKIVILGDKNTLLAHSPGENCRISHVEINIADKNNIMPFLLQGKGDPAANVMVNEEFHTCWGNKNTRSEATKSAA